MHIGIYFFLREPLLISSLAIHLMAYKIPGGKKENILQIRNRSLLKLSQMKRSVYLGC